MMGPPWPRAAACRPSRRESEPQRCRACAVEQLHNCHWCASISPAQLIEAHRISHFCAQLHTHLLCQSASKHTHTHTHTCSVSDIVSNTCTCACVCVSPCCDANGRHASGLRNADTAVAQTGVIAHKLRDLRRLAAAGLRGRGVSTRGIAPCASARRTSPTTMDVSRA